MSRDDEFHPNSLSSKADLSFEDSCSESIISTIIEEKSYVSREDEELIRIVVDMEDGTQENIIVHYDDNVDELTRKFAVKHELSEEVLERLRQNIKENIDDALNIDDNVSPVIKRESYTKDLSKYIMKNTKIINETHTLNSVEPEKKPIRRKTKDRKKEHAKLRRTAKSFSRLEDKLLSRHKQERIEQLRQIKLQEEIAKCTFKPKLTKHTSELAIQLKRSKSKSDTNKFDLLFDDAKRRRYIKEQKNELISECTFKPNIEISQQVSKRILTEKVNHVRKSYKSINYTYRPKISRGPKVERRLGNMSIGEYLYMEGKKKLEQLSSLENKKHLQEWENTNKSYVQDESKRIVDSMKITSFTEVFNILDHNSDGVICIETIDVESKVRCKV